MKIKRSNFYLSDEEEEKETGRSYTAGDLRKKYGIGDSGKEKESSASGSGKSSSGQFTASDIANRYGLRFTRFSKLSEQEQTAQKAISGYQRELTNAYDFLSKNPYDSSAPAFTEYAERVGSVGSEIDSYVDALKKAGVYSDSYSQAFQGIRDSFGNIGTYLDEQYKQTDEYKMLTYDSEAGQKEIDRLKQKEAERNKLRSQMNFLQAGGGAAGSYAAASGMYTQDEREAEIERLQGELVPYANVDTELEQAQSMKYYSENLQKYNEIQNRADFTANSQYRDTGTGGWWNGGIQAAFNFSDATDRAYEFINNQEEIQSAMGEGFNSIGQVNVLHLDLMEPDERKMFTYLYNTQGKEAASEYLDYIQPELNRRNMQNIADQEKAYAQQNFGTGLLSSIASVPNSLAGGLGALDVTLQNIQRDITGEYKPIDYNTNAMIPSIRSSAARQAVSESIVNATGEIKINEEEHPYLAKIFNGKSLADVYNVGMSIADSAAVALFSKGLVAIGVPQKLASGIGSSLLGGNAASQGMIEAVANGATDEQALQLGLMNGLYESLFEAVSIDNLTKDTATGFFKTMLKQGGIEASEEAMTTIANTFADIAIMAENSGYEKNVSTYMEQGMTREEAEKQAFLDSVVQVGWDAFGGFLSGGVSAGGKYAVGSVMEDQKTNKQNKQLYGESIDELVSEGMELTPDNKFVQKMQGKIDAGKDLSGRQITRLVNQNDKAIRSSVQQDAAQRLTELGETGNVQRISAVLAKQAMGEELSNAEQRVLSSSRYGNQVAEELRAAPEQQTGETAESVEEKDTGDINADDYGRVLAEIGRQEATADPTQTVSNEQTAVMDNSEQVPSGLVESAPHITSLEQEQSSENPVSIDEIAQKYGAQSSYVKKIYNIGSNQDVKQFDSAFERIFNYAQSGTVRLDVVKNLESIRSVLTDKQIELAYETGTAAANTAARNLEANNLAQANGKNGRKIGVVKGEGVSVEDLKKTFNDNQNIAYKILSTYAEATGIDIVLYQSEMDASGNFQGAQGQFKRGEPGTIYIDINAGLNGKHDVGNLAKYTMLRTFAHEFTHFIEKWNPVQYNEFRKVVFDTLRERGENVDDLVEAKQATGLSYDMASREVVAEAMTDILPDTHFVQNLAEKHKSIFQKLMEKLKEFVEDLRSYFNSLGKNRSREANALKQQVGETVRYVENVVKMFDQVAEQAVENYQLTVAVDEVTGGITIEEKPVAEVAEENVTETEDPAVAQKAPETSTADELADTKVSEEYTEPQISNIEKKSATKKSTASHTVETSVKLEDFGEKIGGARKDAWSGRGLILDDLSEMNDRERSNAVKKDNVWRRPDYRKLVEGGESRALLFARNEIRKTLNQNITYPRVPEDMKNSPQYLEKAKKLQEDFVRTVREIQKLAENAKTAEDFMNMGRKWLRENGYITSVGNRDQYTEKWRSNPALRGSDYATTVEYLSRNFDMLDKLAEKKGFAADVKTQVPKGFSIHQDSQRNGTWFAAKGSYIIRDNFQTYDDALNFLKQLTAAKKRKTRFVPKQLLEVHRKGPDYRSSQDVTGQDYLDTFGFRGGEFGNWMSEKDRRVSMNYGFDALKDLADALQIADADISLGGNLSIAFGSRGQGLSGAAAHYEPDRHVINLTKMNGAGSLAHEWFHALDDYVGGYRNNFATVFQRGLPENTSQAIRHLITTMQYRDATQAETDLEASKRYEQARRSVTYNITSMFSWVEKMEAGTLTEGETKYFKKKPTADDAQKFHDALNRLLDSGDAKIIEELSDLRKEVYGRVIPKEIRDSIGYRLYALRPDATKNTQRARVFSDFYRNSRKFNEIYQKDGDYWDSTVEMAARAFACYIADKTGARNDYLSAHSDSAVGFDVNKSGELTVIKAFPEGQERIAINAAFDSLFAALKDDGFLHHQEDIEKPGVVQYQSRHLSGKTIQNQREYLQSTDGRITKDMSDKERYEILNGKRLLSKPYNRSFVDSIPNGDFDSLANIGNTEAFKVLRKVGEQFGIFHEYENADAGIRFSFSKGNLLESVHKQSGAFQNYARMMSVFSDVIENAVGIEIHSERYSNVASQLDSVYVFVSAFNTESGTVPVLMEVKSFRDSTKSTLHIAVSLHEIERSRIIGRTYTDIYDDVSRPLPASSYSIADLFRNVNPKDTRLIKYIPDNFLDAKQLEAKATALREQQEYIVKKNADKYRTKATEEQKQQRTSPLTDRDVLEAAANDVGISDMSDAEQAALQTFKDRLTELHELQEKRAEAGRLYKKQQFGANVDRQAASQTLERMRALDDQIKTASVAVLDVEQKSVLQRVLKKARKVVEQQERDRSQAVLKRWRDRRDNADAVKKYRARVEKSAKALIDMLSHPTKDAHVPYELQVPLQDLLDSIDFTSKTQNRGGAPTIRDRAYTSALHSMRLAIAGQRTAIEGAENGAYSLDVPPEFLNVIDEHIKKINQSVKSYQAGTSRVYDMTSSELADLAYLLVTINKAIRDIDKLHMAGAKARISELAVGTMQEMRSRKPVKGDSGNRFIWANYTPWYAFRAMGKDAQQIFKGLMQGQAKLARTSHDTIAFTEKTYKPEEAKNWEQKIHTIKLSSGETIRMTTAQIMSFWCLSNRQQGAGHLTGGGIRIGTIRDENFRRAAQNQRDIAQKEHFVLTLDDIAAINGLLTERQRTVARELQQYMQNVGGRLGNEISMARWDFMQFTEDGYFPIQTDDATRDVKNPGQDKTNLWALLNKSFTKSLTPNAKNAVIVNSIFDVFADHMTEMAEYNAFALPLVDAMKWFNYRHRQDLGDGQIADVGVQKSIRDTLGTAAVKYFVDLMTDLNSSQKAGRHENILGQILSRTKAASVGWNLRVAVQQPTAILRASMFLSMPDLLKGSMRIGTAQSVKEMQQYSGIALWKSMGFYDVNVSRGVRGQIKGTENLLDKFNSAGMWLPAKMDEFTWARIWESTKAKVQREQHLTGEPLLKATAELFEDIVYQSQVADSILTRSSFMRSKSQAMREATSFMSEPTLSSNILISAFQDFEAGHTTWDKAKRAMVIGFEGYVLPGVVTAMVTALMDAWRDDDKYETFWEKYLQAFFGENSILDGNLFSEMNPLEKIIFVRDALSIIRGYDVMPGYADLFKQGYDFLTSAKDFFTDRGSMTLYGLIYRGLQVIGNVGGFGFAGLSREIVAGYNNVVQPIWNKTFGQMYPNMELSPIRRYEPSGNTEIKNAFLCGYLTEEEAISELVRQGLSDTENDAYFLVQGWSSEEENYTRYSKVFDAVRNNGDFNAALNDMVNHGYERDTVIRQVRTQIGQWYQGGEISKSQAMQMLKKYVGLDNQEVTEQVNRWSSYVVTGIKFDDIKQAYLDGEITLNRAIEMYALYGSYTKERATEIVSKWGSIKETGYEIDELDDAYFDGEVGLSTVRSMYIKYGGYTAEEAGEKTTVLEFIKQNPACDGISYAAVSGYNDYCKRTGVNPATFYDVWKFKNDAGSDYDVDGEVTVSKKEKVMDYIDGLNLIKSQKDSLYYACGYAESTLNETPWH